MSASKTRLYGPTCPVVCGCHVSNLVQLIPELSYFFLHAVLSALRVVPVYHNLIWNDRSGGLHEI